MSMALMARTRVLPCLVAGLLLGGGLTFSLSGLAQDQRVVAAEAAAEQMLPPEARVIGSQALDPSTADVLVDYRAQVIQVRMRQTESGWQQDLNATLLQGAEDLQQALAQGISVAPAFGQAPESLLETTTTSTSLIPPTDINEATRRALDRAGRSNPFAPLDEIVPTTPDDLVLPPIGLPADVEQPDVVELPPLPTEEPPPSFATPTPDPAAFARSVAVTGIVRIDGESYTLLDADGQEPAVVQTGQNYQTARVAQISSENREVVLSEGGQFVSKPISASVLTEAP